MSHTRRIFAFDPKRFNEQAARDQSLKNIRSGVDTEIEIHKHKDGESCQFNVTTIIKLPELLELEDNGCYRFTEETNA